MSINNLKEIIAKIRKIDISKITGNKDTIRYFKIESALLEKLFDKYKYLSEQYLQLQKDGWGVVDYGGGIGLLSIFSKLAGFEEVIYVDNNNNYLSDAKLIGKEIGIMSDYYCFGEIDDAVKLLNNDKNYLIMSDNVIEHIYNLESFFLKIFSGNKIGKRIVIMSTSANPYNFLTIKRLKKHHHNVEYHGRQINDTVRSMDERESFLEIRKRIIRSYLQSSNIKLESLAIDQLSKLTKGFKETDIIRYMDAYLNNKILQNVNLKYTNTCEPFNGNWAERIIDLDYLQKFVNVLGVSMEVKPGLFDRKNIKLLRYFRNLLLNFIIIIFPKLGLKISPYIIITFNKTV